MIFCVQYTGRRDFNGIDQEMTAFLSDQTSYDDEDEFGIASDWPSHRFLIHRFRMLSSSNKVEAGADFIRSIFYIDNPENIVIDMR